MIPNHYSSDTMPESMIVSKFPALKRIKSAKENRDITLREIAEATNLSLGTIHKLSTGNINGVKVETLNALCRYFGVGIGDLIEYKAD